MITGLWAGVNKGAVPISGDANFIDFQDDLLPLCKVIFPLMLERRACFPQLIYLNRVAPSAHDDWIA